MTVKSKNNEIDPLAERIERNNILRSHIRTKKVSSSERKQADKSESQQTDKAASHIAEKPAKKINLIRFTARIPESIHEDLELVYLELKRAERGKPRTNKKRVLIQDLITEALDEYVKKMKKKLAL